MRWWLSGLLAILVLLIVIPAVFSDHLSKDSGGNEAAAPEDPDKIIIYTEADDIKISMYNHVEKKLVVLPLEEYLVGVVAGEMPASFNIEALKAQAVAARTLAVYKMQAFGGKGCELMEGADICSSYAHCQEWISEESRKKNWGADYESNMEKIRRAVLETSKEIIKYEGKPIEVLYHSTSNGKTEDAGEVFSFSLPYYKVVESEGEEDYHKFNNSVTIKNSRFVEIFKKKYPGSTLKADNLAGQIKINGYTGGGRVKSITVGGITLRGTDFRLMYGLSSADFSFKFGKNTVTIETRGFGHGVGMSQVGADRMADKGYKYKEILAHYYQGVTIGEY